MATEYTPNYNLDLYVSTDKPNLRDQYNAAMGKIDTELKNQHDDNVSTNNNISTLQTQMKNAENDIDTLQTQQGQTSAALEQLTETVDGFESQIAGKAPTSHASNATTYGAASLTQYGHVKLSDTASQDGSEASVAATPVAVSNAVAGAVDDLSDAIEGLQGSTAPKNHAAAGNTYGLGSSTMYGHVKVTDTPGVESASTGTAASPRLVNVMQEALKATMVPKIYTFGPGGSGNFNGSLCVNEGVQLCTLRLGFVDFTPSAAGQLLQTGFVVPEEYRPTSTIRVLVDVNSSTNAVTVFNVQGTDGDSPGAVGYQQYASSPLALTGDAIITWFYGATPATL